MAIRGTDLHEAAWIKFWLIKMNSPKVSITVSLFVKKDQNQSVSELASDLKALINQLKNDKKYC